MAHKTKVKFQVFTSEGVMVKTLLDEEKEAGTYELEFLAEGGDTGNPPGGATSSSGGIYIYQLQAGNFSETRQMMVICPPMNRSR